MSTRTVAARLEALIEQIAELEDLGGKIQTDDEASALKATPQLDQSYRTWFASALTLLPDDLKERFRFEYEGDIFRNRIKHFLSNPRELSTIYPSLSEEVVKTLNPSLWQYPFNDTFRGPLTSQKQILMEAQARYGVSSDMLEGLSLLERVARRLPISFAILRQEIQRRPGIEIVDEYDVQRLLHAVAVLLFEEVEDEDPTPKMAGASSRLDFLLRRERIAVETKMIGANLTIKRLRSDLAEDILYFRAHPDAGSLFIFVFDPIRKITNATGFERDLHSDSDEFPVRVVVAS
jgi:hypothetical protein